MMGSVEWRFICEEQVGGFFFFFLFSFFDGAEVYLFQTAEVKNGIFELASSKKDRSFFFFSSMHVLGNILLFSRY